MGFSSVGNPSFLGRSLLWPNLPGLHGVGKPPKGGPLAAVLNGAPFRFACSGKFPDCAGVLAKNKMVA